MNIFILDSSPKVAAEYHNDFHVRKMILETAQILSTALRTNGAQNSWLYKSAYVKHPCVLACSKNKSIFEWTLKLGINLSNEYLFRFGKLHKSSEIISLINKNELLSIIPNDSCDFPLAMPEVYKHSDPVKSYRNYYASEKRFMKNGKKMDVYTKRKIPEFMLTASQSCV
jgi:hypothetical protein